MSRLGFRKLRQHVAGGLATWHAGFVAVSGTGWDVQHVAWPGFDSMVVELIADTTLEDENAVASFAPVWAWFTRITLLVTEGDTKTGERLANLETSPVWHDGVVVGAK